jgi:hypothetical protein
VRALAIVSGARPPGAPGPTPGRVAAFVRLVATLGPVDAIVMHDERSSATATRSATELVIPPDVVGRRLEVAVAPPRRSGMIREVHLHRSDAEEVAARATPAFLLADEFIEAAPSYDVVWCGDLVALTRAGWLRRSLPAVVDVDRHEDLSNLRLARAARREASTAHLVTVPDGERREQLGIPGSIVLDPAEAGTFGASIHAVVEAAAAYQPVRTAATARPEP